MNQTDASKQIDQQIAELKDWRGEALAKIRKIVREADPAIAEEWKWGTAVYTHNGLVLAAAAFKESVKLNFFQGASLPDPHGLFNAGLDAKKTRAVDFHKGDRINEAQLKDLIRAAIARNNA